jgi:predicted CXXCH cytochrome family protein
VTAAADPYSRCPDCRFIAPPESMDYALTGSPPDGGIDWSRPVHVTCMICHARHDITTADVLQVDATMVCKRCSASVTYPHGAARVQCTGCGLFLVGPDLDEAQRAELDITERLAGLALRETYLAAMRRADLADVALVNPARRRRSCGGSSCSAT